MGNYGARLKIKYEEERKIFFPSRDSLILRPFLRSCGLRQRIFIIEIPVSRVIVTVVIPAALPLGFSFSQRERWFCIG
jgi:hypothetical protein